MRSLAGAGLVALLMLVGCDDCGRQLIEVDDDAGRDANGQDASAADHASGADQQPALDHAPVDIGSSDRAGNDSARGDAGFADRSGGADRSSNDLCPAGLLGQRLDRDQLLVGGSMEDVSFAAQPFDLNYRYLAGAVPEDGTCNLCTDQSCTAAGLPCSDNSCPWWGCWQWVALEPGRYVADHIDHVAGLGGIPMITYYVWLEAADATEGGDEVTRFNNATLLRPYLQDFRFLCQVIGEQPATPTILHLEPDLWGYAEQVNSDPTQIAAALSGTGITECSGQPNTLVGLTHCLIILARQYAPNALIGFHASAWGAGHDALGEAPTYFDVADHARTTAAFYRALGADQADLIVVEMSDRDAGYYESLGRGNWWDPLNVTPPHFHQAILWVQTLSQELALAALWWQVPYGNMNLLDLCDATHSEYRDNRVDYFFDHPAEFAAGNALGIAFGAGTSCQTTAETDHGHFLQRAGQYFAGGRPLLCGP